MVHVKCLKHVRIGRPCWMQNTKLTNHQGNVFNNHFWKQNFFILQSLSSKFSNEDKEKKEHLERLGLLYPVNLNLYHFIFILNYNKKKA